MKSLLHRLIAIFAYLALAWEAAAVDKNGVSPQVISLPSGPGSIQGLGESFQPQLNTGAATYAIPILVPSGPGGYVPQLRLQYNSGLGNGVAGIGWSLSGLVSVSRNLDSGVPLYVDGTNGIDDDLDGIVDNVEEIDRITGIDGEELILMAEGHFRAENEREFYRYERSGNGWVARARNGERIEFGSSGSTQIEDAGQVFRWLIEKRVDINGNEIQYRYVAEPNSPGQQYIREIRWGGQTEFYSVTFGYASNRPDVHSDYRSGFEVRTGLRLAKIDVIAQGMPLEKASLVGDHNGDNEPDALIRRYVLEYSTNSIVSTLSRVTLVGADGVSELPATSLTYSSWDAPTFGSLPLVYSDNDPVGVGIGSSTELIDLNSDGLPDLLSTVGGAHQAYINQGINESGLLTWTGQTPIAISESLDLASPSVHLADVNADGLADLVLRNSATSFKYFRNTGQTAWDPFGIDLASTDTWPAWPFEGTEGDATRTLDIDHNRHNDVLFTSNTQYRLWMLLATGRYAIEQQLPPLFYDGEPFLLNQPGTHIADLNGDRLSDLVWMRNDELVFWPSRGRGGFDNPVVWFLDVQVSTGEIDRTAFTDVNGDGLADLIVIRPDVLPDGIYYWVNLGQTGLDVRREVDGLPPFSPHESIRFADMNGNGSGDILISNGSAPPGQTELVLDLLPAGRPYLLTHIDNGMGLGVQVDYETSARQMIEVAPTQPWVSTVPLSIPVVAQITEDDQHGSLSIRLFDYRDPYFDASAQEFRGFESVEVREIGDASAPTRLIRYQFDSGRSVECLKGKEITQEILSASELPFLRREHTWSQRVLAIGAAGEELAFAVCNQIDVVHYEGTSTPVRTRTVKDYDAFGNMVREDKLGITDGVNHLIGNDESFTVTDYIISESNWITDRPWRSTVRDAANERIAEKRFYYDNLSLQQLEIGNLSTTEEWLNTEDRYIATRTSEYDVHGNITASMDANGHRRTVAYDPTIHAFPVSETIHLEDSQLSFQVTYDLILGTILTSVDFAGATTMYSHDALGRLVRLERPGDAIETYTYELGTPRSKLVHKRREDSTGNTYDAITYFDGFGRKIGTKVEAENGQWRYLDCVQFNARKLEHLKWLPYISQTSDYEIPEIGMSHSELEYDVRDRKVKELNPDGTFTRCVHEPLIRHLWDENDNAGSDSPASLRFDGRDLLIEVIERSGPSAYSTSYEWDVLENLSRVVDAQGNERTFDFDSLGRLVGLGDPDRGNKSYDLDDAGNIIRAYDGKGQIVEYSYDFADRLISENVLDQGEGPGSVEVAYSYDTPAKNIELGDGSVSSALFTGGRLASVSDEAGSESFSYDARGNKTWTSRTLIDPWLDVPVSYSMRFEYDPMDRLVGVIYPDNDRVQFHHNEGAFIERIDGGVSGQVVVASLDYEATGQRSEMVHGDGSETHYNYDNRRRLIERRTEHSANNPLIHLDYGYDPASNIESISDLRPFESIPDASRRRNTQLFEYDDLYRLTRASYAPNGDEPLFGDISYTYDSIGNMLSQVTPATGEIGNIADPKVDLGNLSYSGGRYNRLVRNPGDPPGPHAFTSSSTSAAVLYDDNGNVVNVDGGELTWNYREELVRYIRGNIDSTFKYDYLGRRVGRLVVVGSERFATSYINEHFEIRPGQAPTKYVSLGGERVAQVKGTIDPSRSRIQRLWLQAGWNALTVAVQTDESVADIFGPDVNAFYLAKGDQHQLALDAKVPNGTVLWIHSPSARVVSTFGPYDESLSDINIASEGQFVAWAKLEPFIIADHSANIEFVTSYSPDQDWVLIGPDIPPLGRTTPTRLPVGSALWCSPHSGGQIRPNGRSLQDVLFYHLDHVGSITAVTDLSGALVAEFAYYPFGLIRNMHSPGTSALTSPSYEFGGKERDGESGFHYFEARWLVSHLGRFLSHDPFLQALPSMSVSLTETIDGGEIKNLLLHPQFSNPYSYGGNNPLKYVDPTGRSLNFITGLYGNYTGKGNNPGTDPINIVDWTSKWHDEHFVADEGLLSWDFWSKPSNLAADAVDLGLNIILLPRVLFYDSWHGGKDTVRGDVVYANLSKIAWYSLKIPFEILAVGVREFISLFD